MSYQDLVLIVDKGKEFVLGQTNYTSARFVLYRDETVFEMLSLTDWKGEISK